MKPMTDKAGRLRDERQRLTLDAVSWNPTGSHVDRINAIDRELAKLARRKLSNRVYRELMFDLNGHHGRA